MKKAATTNAAPPADAQPVPAVAAAAKPKAPKQAKEPKVVKEPRAPKEPKAPKESKVRKPKLVRDSFTFPEADYALLAELKQRALAEGHEIKKSELLRAGLIALAALPPKSFLARLAKVERIKTGRPGKA